METVVQNAPAWQIAIVSALPIIFLVGSIVLLVVAIRYFVALGRNVRAIRELLEERKSQGK